MIYFKIKCDIVLFFVLLTNFVFCWDILRYNPDDNAMYIGATRIVSAPQNITSQDLTFWDVSTRTMILVVSGYIYGNPVTAFNYNIASTSTQEVAGVDYFKFTYDRGELPRDRAGRIIGDYGPTYAVLFDDERQRGSAYPGYSPGTQWVSTYEKVYIGRGGSYERETRTGYIKWSKTISTASLPSDTPVTVQENAPLPADLVFTVPPSFLSIPNGSLTISRSRVRGGSTVLVEGRVD